MSLKYQGTSVSTHGLAASKKQSLKKPPAGGLSWSLCGTVPKTRQKSNCGPLKNTGVSSSHSWARMIALHRRWKDDYMMISMFMQKLQKQFLLIWFPHHPTITSDTVWGVEDTPAWLAMYLAAWLPLPYWVRVQKKLKETPKLRTMVLQERI